MNAPDNILALDRRDKLSSLRSCFSLPDSKIYLDGNSLGPLPNQVPAALSNTVKNHWGLDLIESWNSHHWIDLPVKSGEKIAELIGAAEGQVVCCDSISINLYKSLGAALSLAPEGNVILSQGDNFPTDLYVAQSFAKANDYQLRLVDEAKVLSSIDESVSIVLLTEVNFRTGARHNINDITRLAHENGALVIWDLAHSAGAVPLRLDEWAVDFAVGCGYKFLNGGPGAPAFIYAAKRHQDHLSQPLAGWMGHHSPFSFDPSFKCSKGPKQFLSGTPNILSMLALDTALDLFYNIDMESVFTKSVSLSRLFIDLFDHYPSLQVFDLVSPRDAKLRGSQIALSHPDAYPISQALIDKDVIVDFREPNILRFGITPLYTRYQDIWQAVHILNKLIESRTHQQAKYQVRKTVT